MKNIISCPCGRIRGVESRREGVTAYKGIRYAEAGRWEELYGRRAKLTFGLDIYAPGKNGAAECQETFERMADALRNGAPLGLNLESLSRGEDRFDETLGLFCCPAEAVCDAFLYAVADEGGAFLDFEVRGGRKI